MAIKTKISAEVAFVLGCGRAELNIFYLPEGNLSRELYVAANKVLTDLGGEWDRKLKGHVFKDPPMEKIFSALDEGESVNEKKRDNFFETPPELVIEIVNMATYGRHGKPVKVLEPSAGNGAILRGLLKKNIDPQAITAYEINEDRAENLKSWFGGEIICTDFTQVPQSPDYDIIVMNPPFSVQGLPQADIAHVLHAVNFLKPGGRLVSIMSAGFIQRSNYLSKKFLDYLQSFGTYWPNESGSFKESGTAIETITVKIDKKEI